MCDTGHVDVIMMSNYMMENERDRKENSCALGEVELKKSRKRRTGRFACYPGPR